MAVTPLKIAIQDYAEREVQMFTYEFDQATDIEGQMSGLPRGGKLVVYCKALNDGSPQLFDWMVQRNLAKSGTITFNKTTTGEKMKDIKFEGGYCVDFQEVWEEGKGHMEKIVISCQKIQFGNVVFENPWK